ncbi:MAG: hypothetical protein ACRCZF_22805 [Gemmataceae bacterium]
MSTATPAVSAPPQPYLEQPFGLPTGSVRGIFSILICSFFWLTLLWPGDHPVRALLAHFFMLGLVLMAFASHPTVIERGTSPFIPWLLRVIFVGVSVGVVLYVGFKDLEILKTRLTPDPVEVKEWWTIFLGMMALGFTLGIFLRWVLGRQSHLFRSLRAWLSIVGMIMLVIEFVLVLGLTSSEAKPLEMIRAWQCAEIAVVTAYFGTRM